MDTEEQQGNNLSALMKNAPAIRQVLLLVGLAVSIGVGLATAMWLRDSAHATLYSNLNDAEAAQIVQTLQSSGVEFELDDRSGAILVPQDSVYSARMALASAGLPRGSGFGMEIIQSESGITSSQYMETARLQHALETELARSIAEMQAVQSARVHLGLPQSSVFIRDRRNRSATVVVNLLPGRNLGPNQIRAIASLVAGGVPDLQPEEVMIVDQYSNLLSTSGVDDDLAASERQRDYERQLESGLEEEVLALLGPVVGPENVRVSVSADVDFTVQEESREQYDPASAVVRSEQLQEDRNNANTVAPAGVPGALSNTPPQVGANAQNAGANPGVNAAGSESVRQTRNFELDRTMSVTRHATGTISRLSVAVLIDDAIGGAGGEDEAADAEASAALLEDLVAKADQLVRQAVGFNEARGDTLTITTMTFYEPAPLPEIEAPSFLSSPAFASMLRQGLSIAAILLVGFGLARPIVRMVTAPAQQVSTAAAALPGAAAAMATGQLSYDDKIGAARQLVDRDAERVARIVREWVGEDG